MRNAVILGGGISGLSAAWKISALKDFTVDLIEKEERVGGVSGYFDFYGLKLDYGAHKIYSVIPGIMDEFKDLGAGRLITVKKDHKIILRGRLLQYPVKLADLLPVFKPWEIVAVGLSVLRTMATAPFIKNPVSYEDYCRSVFGGQIYNIVFKPLAEKTWGDPRSLSADIGRTRIPTKDIYDLILRVTGLKRESKDTNAEFMYYPRAGFYDICEAMADKITEKGGSVRLGKRPAGFALKNGRITSVVLDDKSNVPADVVISSIPLEELFMLAFPDGKAGPKDGCFVPMRHSVIVYLAVNRPKVLKNQWIFCADKDVIFSRISEQKLITGSIFPGDKTVISCDFTCDGNSPLWAKSDGEIAELCVEGLVRLKMLKKRDVSGSAVARLPNFYPVYKIGYKRKLKALVEKINGIENLITTGRLGLSSYLNIDHCLDMGMLIASGLEDGTKAADINNMLLNKVLHYRIVD